MKTTSPNAILWSTLKVEKQEQETWGNRTYTSVSIRTDLTDERVAARRILAAIEARFPFRPSLCTNQHSNVTVDLKAGVAKWETYHSIGD